MAQVHRRMTAMVHDLSSTKEKGEKAQTRCAELERQMVAKDEQLSTVQAQVPSMSIDGH